MMANCHGPPEKAARTVPMDNCAMTQLAMAMRKMVFRF